MTLILNFTKDGGFNDVASTLTFIATKCDDVSCSEVIDSLNLDGEPELEEIEERLSHMHAETKEWKEKKADAEKNTKGDFTVVKSSTLTSINRH